jgi:phthalate 4,5-dioxygenase oxygenase subunit
MYVPIEDGSSWRWDFGISPTKMGPDDAIPRRDQIDENFVRFRNRNNDYLIDREEQQDKTFLGIGFNFLPHDGLATETMGKIYDRRTEHLGVSDQGVIAVRNRLLKAVDAYQKGGDLPHRSKDPEEPMGHIDTFAELMPNDVPWREYYAHLTLNERDAPPDVETTIHRRGVGTSKE